MKEKKTGGKVIKIILIVFLVMLLAFFLLVMCTPDESENGGGAEGETAETEESYQTAENKGRNEAEKTGTNTDTKPYGDPDTSWTIMLYLCGTDLESDVGFASLNLEEIVNSNLSENVNFLIETGGTRDRKSVV